MKRWIQFRSLFHWEFRMVSGIQGGLSPSAVPPFPVLMARNIRSVGVTVYAWQLWASASSEWHADADRAHDP